MRAARIEGTARVVGGCWLQPNAEMDLHFCSFGVEDAVFCLRSEWPSQDSDTPPSTVKVSVTDGERVFRGTLDVATLQEAALSAGVQRGADVLDHTRKAWASSPGGGGPYSVALRKPSTAAPELRWRLHTEGNLKVLLGRLTLTLVQVGSSACWLWIGWMASVLESSRGCVSSTATNTGRPAARRWTVAARPCRSLSRALRRSARGCAAGATVSPPSRRCWSDRQRR